MDTSGSPWPPIRYSGTYSDWIATRSPEGLSPDHGESPSWVTGRTLLEAHRRPRLRAQFPSERSHGAFDRAQSDIDSPPSRQFPAYDVTVAGLALEPLGDPVLEPVEFARTL